MALMALADPLPLDIATLDLQTGPEVPTALIVPLGHPLARHLERAEADVFAEAPTLFDVANSGELFHFLVISVDGSARHIARLSGPGALSGRGDLLPFFLTDLADADPTLELQDVRDHYAARSFDIERTISVETQVRLGPHLEPVRSADLLYLALFELTKRRDGHGVLAHMNAAAVASFRRVGLQWHPFADRVDLRTPTVAPDGRLAFDPDYHPVCIPRRENEELLESLSVFTPELVFL